MTSNDGDFSQSSDKTSLCRNSTRDSSSSLFVRAIANASSEISQASTSASGSLLSREIAMHPLPVPISNRRRAFGFSSTISSTSSAVSGRGISTPEATLKFLPQNSAIPRMYCIGSFFCKRNIMFSNSRCLHSDKIISLPM